MIAAALVLVAGLQGAAPAADALPAKISGVVETFDGQTLTVKEPDGRDVAITFPSGIRVTALANRTLADIKPGDFVGSAAVADADGKLHAQEVHIFPEQMRGAGEGHRPMSQPGQTMTNATVADVVVASDGRTLTLRYPGGEKKIDVGPDARIVMIVPGDVSLLKPGAAVAVYTQQAADGSLSARGVQVEKDGVKPL
jgi:hypothetical protein